MLTTVYAASLAISTVLYVLLPLIILALAASLIKAKTKAKKASRILVQRNLDVEDQHQKIERQKEKLEELNEIKDRMFSIVAHDFRSPLNTIQGVLNLLHIKALSENELHNLLPDLTRKVDASINLLDNLLHWSRSQMQGVHTVPCSFLIKQVVDETVTQTHQLAQQKDILIQTFVDPELSVWADIDMIRLVVRNLLSNAIKFSHTGHAVHIEALANDQFATVTVTDFGVGVPTDARAHLFDYSGYTTRGTAQEKGTGLGLNLCYECVTQNRGQLWLNDPTDAETAFSFTVPLAKVALAKSSPALAYAI